MAESSVEGLAELSAKLNRLEKEMAAKSLRQALAVATTPIVRDARLRIPVGDEPHRTYKGNLVAPGFAKRSIRRASRIVGGVAQVRIGVRREAFYATQFVEVGTDNMRAKPWLVPALEAQQGAFIRRFKAKLLEKIKRASR